MLDMSRILVCISGRKSGWFLSEGEEGGGARAGGRWEEEGVDTQTVL